MEHVVIDIPSEGARGEIHSAAQYLDMSGKVGKGLTMQRKVWSGRSEDGPTELIINGQIIDAQNGIGRNTTAIPYE
jgi:hypothetical protein